MTIESSCDTELVAAVGDSGFKLRIRQMGDIPSLNIINGNGEFRIWLFVAGYE